MRQLFALLILLLLTSIADAQSACEFRTDGIYLFDNCIDSIIENDFVSIDSSARQFQVFPKPGDDKHPFGTGNVQPIVDGHSTFLTALFFESKHTGYSINLGIFRDTSLLKRLASICIDNPDQLNRFPCTSPIVEFQTSETNEITFTCQRNANFGIETFQLESCEFDFFFNYSRIINHSTKGITSIYNTKRKYVFISFSDILQEGFIFPDVE